MRRAAHIVVLAVVLAVLCACGHRTRVIPEGKLVRIYHDMFLADQYYLDHSERYVKILNRVETQLRKEGESLQLEADRQTAREVELNKYRRAFRRKDFSTDSLRWAGIQPLWPVDTLPAPVDTLPAPADTLAQRDTLDEAERLEPTRPEKALRRLNRPIKEITD